MKKILLSIVAIAVVTISIIWIGHDEHTEVFQAEYVSSEVCGDCHTINYKAWKMSPHHNITHSPSDDTVVGNFNNGSFFLPEQDKKTSADEEPAVKSFKKDGEFFIALKNIDAQGYTPFKIDKVIGYQYRQTYLSQEEKGVLRRIPVQWSVPRGEFFAYWNEQEQSPHSVADLWEQMKPLNSAWNLYCARCHTTNLQEISKDKYHQTAEVKWTEDGVGCEVCHGPGSKHVEYMQDKPLNRLMSFVDLTLFDKPAPYVINAADHSQGVALSVCAKCHGADILRKRMAKYRTYEPGYDKSGKLNDLSAHFTEAWLEPAREFPTLQVWADGRPKGLGTLFRSFADSSHYQDTDMRCYDCHDPHNNKQPVSAGLLEPSEESNEFCLACHEPIKQNISAHTRHQEGSSGSYCYDCHMPKNILNQVSGSNYFVRSHNMGTIPNPLISKRHGVDKSPNACNECHADESPQWAANHMKAWKMDKHLINQVLHLQRNAKSDVVHGKYQQTDSADL